MPFKNNLQVKLLRCNDDGIDCVLLSNPERSSSETMLTLGYIFIFPEYKLSNLKVTLTVSRIGICFLLVFAHLGAYIYFRNSHLFTFIPLIYFHFIHIYLFY